MFNILTICSEPSDNSTFFIDAVLLADIELAGAALPQASPSIQILTGTLMRSKTASSYFLPLKRNKKHNGRTTNSNFFLEFVFIINPN